MNLPTQDTRDEVEQEILSSFVPSCVTQDTMRHGSAIVCHRCGVPQAEKQFVADSVVCRSCMPKLMGEVRVLADRIQKASIGKTIRNLKQTSEPTTLVGANNVIDKLNARGTSVAELVLDTYDQITGEGESEEVRAAMDPNFGHRVSCLKLLNEQMKIRDDRIFGENPYKDVDSQELLGNALEGLIEEMNQSDDFCEAVAMALTERVKSFQHMVHSLTEGIIDV